ncbi:MAG TPA: shikimate kinase [Candidatus Limnocylindria bacterium]
MVRGGPDRVVLVGMMGCGKTTVGRLLSERLGRPFHDNDAMLRQLFDATPRELLAAGGEEAMHSAEQSVLRAALAMPPPSVLAAAGGTILDPEARAELADSGMVVWLRVTGQTVHRRSAAGAHRPWPDADRAGWIAQAVEARDGLYREVADLVLDADARTPQALADHILDELEEMPATT